MVHLVFANTHTRPKKPKELFFQRYQAVDKFEKKIIEHQKRLNIFDISQMKTNQSEGKILRGKSEKKKDCFYATFLLNSILTWPYLAK
tara:strand:- start:2228 stop:2491 length:264 start_codon:yes stop_codon:yes gene_type:complete